MVFLFSCFLLWRVSRPTGMFRLFFVPVFFFLLVPLDHDACFFSFQSTFSFFLVSPHPPSASCTLYTHNTDIHIPVFLFFYTHKHPPSLHYRYIYIYIYRTFHVHVHHPTHLPTKYQVCKIRITKNYLLYLEVL